MENPESVLHSLEEFAKMKPKDIPRELEDYLKLVAKTGDPVYQWSAIKSLFREKLISVITEFYESCASVEIPPCPNVEIFNYDTMKNFILEKLDTFSSAPFTLQRICELLTDPRKEYTRIDKYMRALEKNILVVSTMEPGGRRTENGEGIMNGIESDHDHVPEPGNEINVEEIDNSLLCPQTVEGNNYINEQVFDNSEYGIETSIDTYTSEKVTSEASTSSQEIVCVQYVSIEPLPSGNLQCEKENAKEDVSVTITAVNIEQVTETTTTIIESKSQDSPVTSQEEETSQKQKSENEADFEEKMDAEPIEPTPSESSEPDSCEDSSEVVADPVTSLKNEDDVPDRFDSDKVSPESSVSCSEIVTNQSETSNDVPDDTENKKPVCEIEVEKIGSDVKSPEASESEKEDTIVDSTTTSDAKAVAENEPDVRPETDEILLAVCTEEPREDNTEADSSTVSKNTTEEPQSENTPEELPEPAEHSKTEEPQPEYEITSALEKPTPMEVDQDSSEQPALQEPESSEPVV